MYCEKCGKQMIDGAKFCDGCGAKATGQGAAPVAAASESYSPLPGTPPFSPPPQPSVPPFSAPPQPSTAAYSAPPQPSTAAYSVPPTPSTPPYSAPPQQHGFNRQQQYSTSSYQPNMAQPQTDAQPMTVGQFIVMFLLLSIPIANIVFLFKWGFGSGVNPNKKNCARAMLIFFVIFIVLWIIAGTTMSGLIMKLSRGF